MLNKYLRLFKVKRIIHGINILILIFMLSAVISTEAFSQVIDVPPGSTTALIDAINQANANPDAAVINLGGGPIT